MTFNDYYTAPLSRPYTYPTAFPHACGHSPLIPLTFASRPHDHELTAARNGAAAQRRYRLCGECERSFGTVDFLSHPVVVAMEDGIAEELERMEGESLWAEDMDEEDKYYYALGDMLCPIWALHHHAVATARAAGAGAVVGGAACSLMGVWVRLALRRLRPETRGRLLFAVRMETGNEEAVQWAAERMAGRALR